MTHLFVIEKNAGIDLEDFLAEGMPASQRSAVDMSGLYARLSLIHI
jgi:hypothetical protein